jgi:hypothetical protein
MKNTATSFCSKAVFSWKNTGLALVAATTVLGSPIAQMSAIARPAEAPSLSDVFSNLPAWRGRPVIRAVRREESRFSLAIVQQQITLPNVIARISLKPKHANGYLTEQLIGDFRYKLKTKQKAKFIKGLHVGDRVVVRLFTPDNQFIGYSEFELLSNSTTVSLVVAHRAEEFGIVRTIYGVDANQDFAIDRNAQYYDYFTQITRVQDYRSARVTFFNSIQASVLNFFNLPGLPTPQPTCSYPTSFSSGSFRLVSQTIQAFGSSLTSGLVALPGSIVQIINISQTRVSVYEASTLIVNYQNVSYSGRDREEDDDRKKPKKRKKQHCNQGIGNGREGCDPGRSRPHGGSNDGD